MTKIIIFKTHIVYCDFSLEIFSTQFWGCQLGGRIFFFLNKTVQTTSIILGKEMFVLPSACLWLVFAFLLRNYGKERDVSILSFPLIKFVIYWELKCCPLPCMILRPASLSKLHLWATSEEWSPTASPVPGAFSVFVSTQANTLSRKERSLFHGPLTRPSWLFSGSLQMATAEIKVGLSLLWGSREIQNPQLAVSDEGGWGGPSQHRDTVQSCWSERQPWCAHST